MAQMKRDAGEEGATESTEFTEGKSEAMRKAVELGLVFLFVVCAVIGTRGIDAIVAMAGR